MHSGHFGAFVEIEEGIDGLVHISDMCWTRRVRHPSDIVKKGQDIEVVVLNIDKKRRRISLGHKQTIENPWPELAIGYAVGNQTQGVITRILERGVVVDLDDDVEGFIPVSQLGIPNLKNPQTHFSDGDELPIKVVEFDEDQRKIVLSVREFLRDVEQGEMDAYLEAHPLKPVTVADVVGEDIEGAGEEGDAPEAEAAESAEAAEPAESGAEAAEQAEPEAETAEAEETPAEASADEPAEVQAETPAEASADEPAEEPVEVSAEEPGEDQAEEAPEASVEDQPEAEPEAPEEEAPVEPAGEAEEEQDES